MNERRGDKNIIFKFLPVGISMCTPREWAIYPARYKPLPNPDNLRDKQEF